MKEMFTDSDNFGVSFNNKMSSDLKSLVFSATFLIDLMYFENKNKN
jgi:hypothetical protein